MLVYKTGWRRNNLKKIIIKRTGGLRRFEGDKKTAARLPLIKLPWQLHTKIEERKL